MGYISFDRRMLAFAVLGLVFSIPSQEIGLRKRLRNDLFCVEWDVNHNSVVSECPKRRFVQPTREGGGVGGTDVRGAEMPS